MTQPHSRTAWTKFKHWLYADPPFVWGDHTALARIKFWTSRFIRFCWRWRDISPGPLFVVIAWLWGHSPIRLLPFPRLPLWGLALVGAGISVWTVHFDSSRGKTANKDRIATKARRHWQKVALDCKFEEIPKLNWAAVKDHATTLNVALIEGTNERKLYLDATRKLHTIYQKPVKFRTNGDGTANIKILHSDPLRDEPTLPAFLGNDDGPTLEPRWGWMPLGIDDDAETFGIRLFENHMLVNGQTGSGKSSSMVAFAVGCIAAPNVSPAALEPARKSFACLRNALDYVAGPHACLDQLREEHKAMEKRHAVMDELDTSLLAPSARTPLRVIFIDEMQNLLDPHLHGDRFVEDFRKLLADILDRGRAVGFCVIGICTNPRKTILTEGLRDQFTYRLVFKVADRTAAQLGLGTVAKYYEPDLLPKVPGRAVFKGDENYQIRTFRLWDQQARNAAASLQPQPAATGEPVAMPPVSPQAPLITGDVSDSDVQLPPRRHRRRSRDETRGLLVSYLQQQPGRLVSEISEDLDIPESNIRYWFGPTCSNPIPVRRLGYRYELVR